MGGETRAGGAKSPGALLAVLRSLGFILRVMRAPEGQQLDQICILETSLQWLE